MVQNSTVGKNSLWTAYQDAGPLTRAEIILELKKANLYRHWYTVACKDTHDLIKAKGQLRDIFLKVMPETAPLFGLPIDTTKTSTAKSASTKKPKPSATNTPTLFDI